MVSLVIAYCNGRMGASVWIEIFDREAAGPNELGNIGT